MRDRLLRNEWTAGQRLPTETDLAAAYGVSRATVRQALESLEQDGLSPDTRAARM